MAFRPDGSTATVKAIYEPLVPWIWFGGGVVVFGAIVGAWPSARRRRAVPSIAIARPPQPKDNAA
jgi:cytochrome c-type biogenesis protein CcmF